MRKVRSSRLEDAKSTLRVVETILELSIFSIIYYIIWDKVYGFPYFDYKGKYVLMGLYALILYILFHYSECTRFSQLHRTDLILGQIISLLLTNFITYFQLSLVVNKLISPVPLILLSGIEVVLAIILVLLYTGLYYKLYAPHDMLLVYGNKNSIGIKFKLDSRYDKYKITRLIPADAGLEAICAEIPKHDAVVINDLPAALRNDILKFCYDLRIRVYISPKVSDIVIRGAKNITLFDTPLLLVKGTGLTLLQRILKRSMDIILCSLGLIIVSPVMLAISIAIKLEDGGPVFFRQSRLTMHGQEFEILKFRSMIPDAEKYSGAILASENDPRITRVGRFIRATRLDELPQIFNILKGEMSIVGPRPERKVIAEKYCRDIPEFSYRLKVRAGLTGYAQVYGKYNTTPYDKLRLDLMYINNYSTMLDFKLIVLTLRILFSKESTDGIDLIEQQQKDIDSFFNEMVP